MAVKPLDKPLVEGPRQARRARLSGAPLSPDVFPSVLTHDGMRVLACVVLVAVQLTFVGMVLMVVVGVIVCMGVLDAVSVRVNVQMRWIGCGLMLGHGNLDTARLVIHYPRAKDLGGARTITTGTSLE